MDATHSEYTSHRRQRPETIALLAMSLALSTPANASFSNSTSDISRYPSGHFDSNSDGKAGIALKLFLVDQKKRHHKNQIFRLKGVELPESMKVLPYRVIDEIVNLGIDVDYILPTEDSGISIEFRHNGTYHLVEFLPSEEIIFLKKLGRNIDTWDLTIDTFFPVLQSELA